MTTPAQVRGGRQARWTRDAIIEKIQRWVALYGEPPRAADLNPSAAKWSSQEWRVARYRKGDPDTGEPWPALNSVKKAFGGSLNEAIRAAGFEPNKSGPPSRAMVSNMDAVDRVGMPPAVRAVLEAKDAEIRALSERVETRDRQLDRARDMQDRLRKEVDVARRERPKAPVTQTKTKTITKTRVERVRVEDTVAVRRAERRAEKAEAKRSEAAARADMERSAAAEMAKSLARVRKEAEAARDALAEAREDAAVAVRDRKAMEDRLTALERVSVAPREVVVERVVRSASDQEVADARRAVARAERAEHEAEVRAARAERLMREQGAAVTGEERRLTQAELAELRKGGPSGPKVLMSAVKEVVEARANAPAKLPAALTRIASAAIRWRDAL